MNALGRILVVGACLLLRPSISGAQQNFEPGRFFLPRDGQPNNNGEVGPFCCTGRTLIVQAQEGYPVAYVYFHDFPGGGVTVDGHSFATVLSLPISAAIDPANPEAPQEKGEIAFGADEMRHGLSRSIEVGGLSFTATIEKAARRVIGGQWYYALGAVGVWLDVSAVPAEVQEATVEPSDLAPGDANAEANPDTGSSEGAVEEQGPEVSTPAPDDSREALIKGALGLLRDRFLRKKPNREACSLRPDAVRCQGAKQRYYYDPASRSCQAFTWGGCEGVVPFGSLKACVAACEGQ